MESSGRDRRVDLYPGQQPSSMVLGVSADNIAESSASSRCSNNSESLSLIPGPRPPDYRKEDLNELGHCAKPRTLDESCAEMLDLSSNSCPKKKNVTQKKGKFWRRLGQAINEEEANHYVNGKVILIVLHCSLSYKYRKNSNEFFSKSVYQTAPTIVRFVIALESSVSQQSKFTERKKYIYRFDKARYDRHTGQLRCYFRCDDDNCHSNISALAADSSFFFVRIQYH